MNTYNITSHDGQSAKATSIREAKAIARTMCVRNVGRSSNMTSGVLLRARRLYWQTWCNGTVIGDSRGYTGTNPMISIRQIEAA